MTKTKKYITITAVIMSLLLIALALTAIFTNGFKDNMSKAGEINGGMVVDPLEDEDYGVSFVSTIIPKEQYADYGISPIAETAQQITATITPSNAEYKVLDWSVAWESGTSGKFGNGKTVTDYVKVTPTSDGALTANLECKQAFGETIILTASLRNFPNIKGTRKVQYQQKLAVGTELNISYTNSSYSTANTTWALGACTGDVSSQEVKSVLVSFPGAGKTFSEFKDYYSATGSKKGVYAIKLTTKGSTVYTKPMEITNVKMYVGDYMVSGKYPIAVSYCGGSVLEDAKYSDSNKGILVASGTGVNATLTGDFDFIKCLGIDPSSNLDLGVYKQYMSTLDLTYIGSFIHFTCTATVNGVADVHLGLFKVGIDASSLGTFASSVSIGSADIVY